MKNLIALFIVTWALLGGIYFGLFSCGGYVWHRQLFWIIFLGLTLLVIFFSPNYLNAIWKKVLFIIAVAFIYNLSFSITHPLSSASDKSSSRRISLLNILATGDASLSMTTVEPFGEIWRNCFISTQGP